jgi:hypothetical protein
LGEIIPGITNPADPRVSITVNNLGNPFAIHEFTAAEGLAFVDGKTLSLNGDLTDMGEKIFVEDAGDSKVAVWAPDLNVPYQSRQTYDIGKGRYKGKIIAVGGKGDDEIDLSLAGTTSTANRGIEFDIQGGEGNDILKAGCGRALIDGGAGDDIIYGGGAGQDFLFGDNGPDDFFRTGITVVSAGLNAITVPTEEIDAFGRLKYRLVEISDGPGAGQTRYILDGVYGSSSSDSDGLRIEWRSAGLTPYETVALINAGGETVLGGEEGNWLYERYRMSGSTSYFAAAVNRDGLSDPAPEAVYQRYASASSGVGNKLGYELPVADDGFETLNEDEWKLITLMGTDADGDPHSYTILENPLHGTLSDFGPGSVPGTYQVTYTPEVDYNGPDRFTFRVDDGKLGFDEDEMIAVLMSGPSFGTLDPADAILALQFMAKMHTPYVHGNADVNGDGLIGMQEVIYILQGLLSAR